MTAGSALVRARTMIDLGRWQDALTSLATVLAEDPEHVEALCLASRCQLALDNPADAAATARRASALAPDHEWPHRLESIALVRLHRYGQARDAADQAVRLAPSEWRTHMQRADVDAGAGWLSADTWSSASRAVELAPHEPAAHITYGRVALAARQHKVAAQSFREALRLDPSNAMARNNLAVVDMRRRRFTAAGRNLVGALRADPQSAIAVANLRLLLSNWLTITNLVAIIGCWIIVSNTDGHDVPGSEVFHGGGGLTASIGSTVVTVPDVPTITVPTPRHVPTTGHPTVIAVVAAICVLVTLACLVMIRFSVGRVLWSVARQTLRSDWLFTAMLVLSLAGLGALVAAVATGMPAARTVTTTVLIIDLLAMFGIRVGQGRLNRRRRRVGT